MLTALSHLKTTPKMYQSSVVYKFKCPGCNANYVEKLIAACTPEQKNIPVMTLPRYITIFAAATNLTL